MKHAVIIYKAVWKGIPTGETVENTKKEMKRKKKKKGCLLMTKELTHGKPLPLILQFAMPLIFGYMLQQLYSLCDTVIVGRCLGVNELAAVGSTGAVSFLVLGFATGICTGMSIPVSQAFGAGDNKALRKYLANAFYLSAFLSVIMTIGTILFTGDLLRLMKTPEELYDYAYDYIFTVFAGISATILYNLLSSMLRSIGDSRTPLIFLAIAAVLNIGLDFLFILVLHTGVAGAGYAGRLARRGMERLVFCDFRCGWKRDFQIVIKRGKRPEPGNWLFDAGSQTLCLTVGGEKISGLIVHAGHDWEREADTVLFTGLDSTGRSVWGKRVK